MTQAVGVAHQQGVSVFHPFSHVLQNVVQVKLILPGRVPVFGWLAGVRQADNFHFQLPEQPGEVVGQVLCGQVGEEDVPGIRVVMFEGYEKGNLYLHVNGVYK